MPKFITLTDCNGENLAVNFNSICCVQKALNTDNHYYICFHVSFVEVIGDDKFDKLVAEINRAMVS